MSDTEHTPKAFVSGRRGQLAMHSRELATWMGINNDIVHGALIWQNGERPESWWIGNCWNKTEVFRLNRSAGTLTVITSYWISESVAMKLCRTLRRDYLPRLRQIFAEARKEDIEQQIAFTGHCRASQFQEAQA